MNTYGKRVLTYVTDLLIDSSLNNEIDDSLFDADLAIKTKPENISVNWEIK